MPSKHFDEFHAQKLEDGSVRQRPGSRSLSPVKSPVKGAEVVVISSDEDDIPVSPRKTVRPIPPRLAASQQRMHPVELAIKPGRTRGPFGSSQNRDILQPARPSSTTVSDISEVDTACTTPSSQDHPPPQSPVKTSHADVIDLTLSSSGSEDSESEADQREVISLIEDSPRPLRRLVKGTRRPDTEKLSLEDGPAHTMPLRRPLPTAEDKHNTGSVLKAKPRRKWTEDSSDSDDTSTRDIIPVLEPRSLEVLPTRSQSPVHSPSSEPSLPSSKKGKAPRLTKKAQREAEQARREAYAEQLFKELNASVFNGGLPETTTLKWSVRLLTTAGRAKWRRSRDGTQTTEIELATKILDSDDRIRNTLSHEMCHLACWIIDGDPKEGHGRAFKAWAAKVTKKRPEIKVSTKHNYEINYPYEWECNYCAKVYGRYSKSIKPEECRCGTCKTGKLVPLFKTQPRTTAGSSKQPIEAELESLTKEMGGMGIFEWTSPL